MEEVNQTGTGSGYPQLGGIVITETATVYKTATSAPDRMIGSVAAFHNAEKAARNGAGRGSLHFRVVMGIFRQAATLPKRCKFR